MPNELVRAVVGDREVNVARHYAETNGLTVLDEPVRRTDGRLRVTSRRRSRPVKPKTSVKEAAAKKAAKSADDTTNPPSPKES